MSNDQIRLTFLLINSTILRLFTGHFLELQKFMYAVIATGGKQYRVAQGDVIQIEKLDAEEGSSIDFENVLMVGEGESVKIGAPYLEGSKVTATVRSQMRGEKLEIMKFRRRKHHQKRTGHRQYLTLIEINTITA